MTIEEAIEKYEEISAQNEESAKTMKKRYGEHVIGYTVHKQLALENRQMAEWLKELKAIYDRQEDERE